jgi:putative spermidine/putrescine transport system ATP-binding protein
MTEAALRLDGVRLDAGGRGLDLAVAPGEAVALLGDNGASGLLPALAGFGTLAQGQVLVRGVPVARTPAHRRGLGLVEADPALLPHLDVARNVALPLRLRGVARGERRERVAAMLERLGIAGLADRKPVSLGLAEAMRVALARVLVFGPPVVLLDDPARGLEGDARLAWLEAMRSAQRAMGVAVLLATRDAGAALAVADRILVLDGGAVAQAGSPGEVYEDPVSAAVAAALGAVNTLPGRVEAIGGGVAEVRLRAGPLVAARADDTLGMGDACLVCVRPERIALAAVEATRMGPDAIPAVVEAITYQGDHARLRLIIGEGLVVLVQRPAAAGYAGLVVNRPAALAWRAEHARAFRAG